MPNPIGSIIPQEGLLKLWGWFLQQGPTEKRNLKWWIKITTPQSISTAFTAILVASTCPLAHWMWTVHIYAHPTSHPLLDQIASVAARTVCFLLWGRKRSERAQRAQRTLTQSLSICLSARVSATGHDCRNALASSFNHSSPLSIK